MWVLFQGVLALEGPRTGAETMSFVEIHSFKDSRVLFLSSRVFKTKG